MPRVMFLGDTHGDSARFGVAALIAAEAGCDKIIQVGDFGYFPHTDSGREFLRAAEITLSRLNLRLYFVDGNHDDHTSLAALPDGKVSEHITHIRRGGTLPLGGSTAMGMGGAGSIDYTVSGRTAGRDWWPQEVVLAEDVQAAKTVCTDEGLSVDVLMAHDRPGVVRTLLDGWPDWVPGWEVARAEASRRNLDIVTKLVSPKLLIHGHLHKASVDISSWLEDSGWQGCCLVIGLAHVQHRTEMWHCVVDFVEDRAILVSEVTRGVCGQGLNLSAGSDLFSMVR